MTQAAASPVIIGKRYRLIDKLGEGGMGAVYRAQDRLTGQIVALKRLRFPAHALSFHSRPAQVAGASDEAAAMQISLANEFQLLASLRHPRIISVLDYGFEDDASPYFTMSLLEKGKPLSVAAIRRDPHGKIDLLIQVLQALSYLHRRGIVHRDLKPGNALDTPDGVKVLDFGLAIEGRDESGEIAGTPRYWSPEILQGAGASVASDLYAVGVIAYEMFAGKPIFDDSSVNQLVMEIMTKEPDFDILPPELVVPLHTLLSKHPNDRYRSADETIVALCECVGTPVPSEPPAIRESFLQAATFVGRVDEKRTLKNALNDAKAGHGSAWLIGGESGVGKSRLINELRIQALVAGAMVVRGQLIREGGGYFQGWRAPAQQLALDDDLNDQDAGILKVIIPEIETLLGRSVPDAPPAGAGSDMLRIINTLTALCLRPRKRFLVILMEDLHWADESLAVLGELAVHLRENEVPLLIVGTFRDDERPDIPTILDAMRLLRLRRLDKEGISQLSASMLGADKTTPELLTLLERETEGNILFLVETLRALAETAGSLNDISQRAIPANLMVGGVQAILRRRLERAPADAQEWIKLAAVAGRQIDPNLMQHIGLTDLDGWLTACVNVAILDTADGEWRFSHDKLRDAALDDLTAEERPALHRKVAEGIESLYPNDPVRAFTRMEHWHAAGEPWKEIEAALDTVEYWFTLGRYDAIKKLCAEVLARIPAPETDEQKKSRALVNMYMGYADEPLGNYETAARVIQESLNVFIELDEHSKVASCYNALGALAQYRGDLPAARDYFIKGVEIRRREPDFPLGLANALASLGTHYDQIDDFENARRYYEESLTICEVNNLQEQMAYTIVNFGKLALRMSDFDKATEYLARADTVAREIGLERVIGVGLVYQAELALAKGDLRTAEALTDEARVIHESVGDREMTIYRLIVLAQIEETSGEMANGLAHAAEAIKLAQELEAPRQVSEAYMAAGFLRVAQCDLRRSIRTASPSTSLAIADMLTAARVDFTAALEAARLSESPTLMLTILIGFARLRLMTNDIEGSAQLRALIAAHPRADAIEVKTRLAALDIALKQAGAPPTVEIDPDAVPTDIDLAAAHDLLKRARGDSADAGTADANDEKPV